MPRLRYDILYKYLGMVRHTIPRDPDRVSIITTIIIISDGVVRRC